MFKLNKCSFWLAPALVGLTSNLPDNGAVAQDDVSATLNQRIEVLLFAGDLESD
jgi:hypothetical protein